MARSTRALSFALWACVAGCGFQRVGTGVDQGSLPDLAEMGAGPDLSAGDLPRPPKRVFVTHDFYPGDMTASAGGSPGVLGGDALCTNLANAARLGGVWRAWLSDSYNNAIDRIVGDGPWLRLDGQLAFANHAALAQGPKVPLDIDQTDTAVPVNSGVWTGTLPDGTRYTDTMPGGGDCQDWTMTGSAGSPMYGGDGDTDMTGGNWTAIAAQDCAVGARLYCFEQ